MQDEDLLVLGYQPDDDGKVKDLILGYYDEKGELKCRGKVYLGESKAEQRIIAEFAKKNAVKKSWFEKYKNVVWFKPQLVGTAHFMHETESGRMRHPAVITFVYKTGVCDEKKLEESILRERIVVGGNNEETKSHIPPSLEVFNFEQPYKHIVFDKCENSTIRKRLKFTCLVRVAIAV